MEIKKLIDAFRPVESRESGPKAEKKGPATGTTSHQGDRISLSAGAQTYRSVQAVAEADSGVRADRVEQIKAQVESNTYQMNSRKTAEKMLEQEYGAWGRQV
ncbi:flagellar biosynthesis anti-sigma factor FlgM [Desulfonatronum parangueonense]